LNETRKSKVFSIGEMGQRKGDKRPSESMEKKYGKERRGAIVTIEKRP